MRAKGGGKYNMRMINKIMRDNGYRSVSERKHMIFKNEDGDMVSLPKNCKDSILKYEFKHHNIKEDI